ncbi:tubby-like F-box protein 5 isoform X2 [Cornus florida]|uniref:tubby-like F-box protein 5 isoform X2 n=1 Tax=Cornus florida TaxID=4283 RepID=UPI002897AF4A|nr:tubby-like F-box protein 5 isoform X2 [Cornus florida]
MPFKGIIGELKRIGNKSRTRRQSERKYRSHIAPERSPSPAALVQQSQWANLPPELLHDIIQRVEDSETSWPARQSVVACAAACRSWREATLEVVRTPEQCGLLTFPISLKQPGPRDFPIQCFIKRDRATSTYRLYLGLTPALAGDASKLILAARKIRRTTKSEFLISLATDDFSQSSNNYVGKLRSNFLGTKFVMYDNQPPHDHAIQVNGQLHQKRQSKMVSSGKSVHNYNVATITYELNVLRTRGPRRLQCAMHSIPISAIQEGGTAPTPLTFGNCLDKQFSSTPMLKGKKETCRASTKDPVILKNKAPRWHEQLQCWCLNFKGRVTVASVKNFQLVAAADPWQDVSAAEQDKVLLQFGKIGKDIFTMDFRYPLSAFQAFAICLSTFGTKPL